MQAIVWYFTCILIPLVGISHASRMIMLSLLPARVEEHMRKKDMPALTDPCLRN